MLHTQLVHFFFYASTSLTIEGKIIQSVLNISYEYQFSFKLSNFINVILNFCVLKAFIGPQKGRNIVVLLIDFRRK